MKKLITFSLLVVLCIIGCTKEQSFSVEGSNPTPPSKAKISINNNWAEYQIATTYMSSYAHWCQLWNSPLTTYEKQNACGPTAYMLAAHMVASAHGYTFMPSSGAKLNAIVNSIGSLPISMNQIGSHISSYDSPPLTSVSYTSSSKSSFKSFLESHLFDGNPIIVPIVVSAGAATNNSRYTSEVQTVNYDLDSSPQTGRPNYVLTSKLTGGYGHFVVVIGISIYIPTGNGLVFYKDPLSSSGATKVCSYTRFLASAKINGACIEPNCMNYDAIVVKKQ